jgi:hypothetical protein
MDAQLVLALSPLIVLGGLLLLLSGIDLARRPSSEVSGGSRIPWAIWLLFIPVGPITYLWFGRRMRPNRTDDP